MTAISLTGFLRTRDLLSALGWVYGRSEGFPLAAYSIPGREGRGPGQNPELFRRRRRRRRPAHYLASLLAS